MCVTVYEEGVRLGVARTNNELVILAARAIARTHAVGLVGHIRPGEWVAHMDMTVGQFAAVLSSLTP